MRQQLSIPAVYMRGGTSKGVFLHEAHVPEPGPERDELMLAIMGSPDPLQIDGMGGTFSSTSKVVIVGEAVDGVVPYTFGQVGIEEAEVDWRSNCGNLTSAVAGFAVDQGIVDVEGENATVPLLNRNSGLRIDADLHLHEGVAATEGDTVVDGVPGSGSPVRTRYLAPSGGVLGTALPSGSARDVLDTGQGQLTVSLVDIAAPYLLVLADDSCPFDVFDRRVEELNSDEAMLAWAEELRRLGARLIAEAPFAPSATVPRIAFVKHCGDGAIAVRALSMGKVHRAVPMTGALCIAGATRLPDTVVSSAGDAGPGAVEIKHPKGSARVEVEAKGGVIHSVGVTRTARTIMRGEILVPSGHGRISSTATSR